ARGVARRCRRGSGRGGPVAADGRSSRDDAAGRAVCPSGRRDRARARRLVGGLLRGARRGRARPARQRAAVPDPGGASGMEFVRQQWDRVGAWAAVAVGALLLLVGWSQVSDRVYPGEQIPYVVIAGLGGLFLLGIGAVLWISAD